MGLDFGWRKFLVPRGRWMKRACLLFSFILFDYLVTLALCKTPIMEGNPLARKCMELYGIPLGLTLFVSLINLPVYLTLCLDSVLSRNLPLRILSKVEPVVDMAFSWFIAGVHFNGAASWFWPIPHELRQLAGCAIYLTATFAWIYEFRTPSLRCKGA